MIIGDGHSFAAAVLLLKDGRLLAATASIHEASEIVSYGTIVVSATFYADSCEELFEALPSFAQALFGICLSLKFVDIQLVDACWCSLYRALVWKS